MKNGDSYVKCVSVLEGEYRNKSITHNFHDMTETSEFVDRLESANLSGVKWIRIVPTAVNFTNPREAASGLDGASGRNHW